MPHEHSLLHDDALVVRVADGLEHLVTPWLPLHAGAPVAANPGRATIDVTRDDAADVREERDGALVLHFAGVRVVADEGDVVSLRGASAARGRIDLGERRARIGVPDDEGAESSHDARLAADVYSMLTLSAAFLVGRLGGALVHAGCVVDPEGRAWPLVGDTHAGKTTTCVSLVAGGGWRYLADDQVVLRFDDEGAIDVQGWPRRAHLDEGWADAVVTGTRAVVDLRARWGDRWVRRAPLGGLLLPTVRTEEPTSLAAMHDASAFTALVRQSPWLMADRGAAPAVMSLLRAAAAHPAFALSLGRDGYARGDVLADRLAPARAASNARARDGADYVDVSRL
jgi:hypothetical protein